MIKSFSLFLYLAVILTFTPSFFCVEDTITIESKSKFLSVKKGEVAQAPFVTKQSATNSAIPDNAVIEASCVATYREDKSAPYEFRIFTPNNLLPNKKYPLIIWLHGAGESLSDNISQLAHMEWSIDLLAGSNRPDFFLIALQCPVETESWYQPDPRSPHGESPLEMLDKITNVLTCEYPIDTDRISLFGICSGATAGFTLIQRFPQKFSAFAACSGNPPPYLIDTYRLLPIWIFNNGVDSEIWRENQSLTNAVNHVGGNMALTVNNITGYDTWTSAQRDSHVLEWLIKQRRGGIVFPQGVPIYYRSKKEILIKFCLPITITVISTLITRRFSSRRSPA